MVRQHQPASFIQSHSFLVLQRAHGRDGTKVVVKGRNAQSGFASQFLDFNGLAEVLLEPVDRPGNLIAMVSDGGDLPQARSLLTDLQAITDFLLSKSASESICCCTGANSTTQRVCKFRDRTALTDGKPIFVFVERFQCRIKGG